MKIEIVNDFQELGDLPQRFCLPKGISINENPSIWFKIDIACPLCKTKGMVIKICYNGCISLSHSSSGIILACENGNGDCYSEWNCGKSRNYPWHTWLSSFHKRLDSKRGNHGAEFLKQLKDINPKLYNKILRIDKEIEENAEQGYWIIQDKNMEKPKKVLINYQGGSK